MGKRTKHEKPKHCRNWAIINKTKAGEKRMVGSTGEAVEDMCGEEFLLSSHGFVDLNKFLNQLD